MGEALAPKPRTVGDVIEGCRKARRWLTPQNATRKALVECELALSELVGKLVEARAALAPFAARVHADGIEAPYPEEEWRPMLDAAKAAFDKISQ